MAVAFFTALTACSEMGGLASNGAAVAPGASVSLTVSAPEFLARCHADVAAAQAGMAQLKTLAPTGSLAPLDVYDSAQKVLRAERVNDFAAPDDINLVCGAVVCGGCLIPLVG
jgi:hypothetical protein